MSEINSFEKSTMIGLWGKREEVGARGFEPPTTGPPDQCANQTALRPES